MPTLILTESFKNEMKQFAVIEQKQVVKALRFLQNDPRHPSLNVHRVRGTVLWEAYVNKDIRILYEQNSDTLTMMAVGRHDLLRKY